MPPKQSLKGVVYDTGESLSIFCYVNTTGIGKLADHEEVFSEFDKKCFGLES